MRVLLIAAAASLCCAQQPEFEVASVKVSPPITGNSVTVTMGGDKAIQRFTNVVMTNLIEHCFEIKSYQLIGPDWMHEERFDIEGKMPAGASERQVPAMLRKLLADRFGLVYHRETRDLPVYVLTVAKGGIKTQAPDKKDEPKLEADGTYSMRGSGAGMGFVELVGNEMSTGDLAGLLSHAFDRPLIDRTGLSGKYRFKMRFREAGDATLADAIREFLGLKVDPGKAPIEVVVIDHLDRTPTAN